MPQTAPPLFGQRTRASAARDYLDHPIGDKRVQVDSYGLDWYKRILAMIGDDQINVNTDLGYA